ncbi:galactokinase [Aquiflexum gelatinilyticum]|uniref:galactokinase n=1 Tax=Aquiflexum gelatinilyticum TaxID=2961943 RepID=UPI0021673275|nr:galactokinase [Aquiflexum gelatinilyticum]MCS4436554.1 galactokinase [Aquiflexum gelatinilyticum]
MKKPIETIFKELFQKEPLMVYSPGRINLIGEHTDYNEGFVMPAAIDKKMIVAIAANRTRQAKVYSVDFEEEFAFNLDSFGPKKGHWATYILGVTAQLQQAGYAVQGFDMVFGGDIPVGAGLSSSAAFEAAVGFALTTLFGFHIPKRSLIHYAQKAEHVFAGVQCGIMDQFASVMGKKGHVIRLDCRSMDFQHFPLNLPNHSILLIDTCVKHSLADSAYNKRRQECQEGVQAAKKNNPDIKSLRDMDLALLDTIQSDISLTVFNRCKYIIEENNRVVAASALLDQNNLKGFGEKMYASHEGLSKLYEVSCPELDFLVDFTKEQDYVLGSRMMGGGFGGCTINIVEKAKLKALKESIQPAFESRFGVTPKFYEVSLEDGTGLI